MQEKPQRRHRPAHQIWTVRDGPTVVFITACTAQRTGWLATDRVHAVFLEALRSADSWKVGRYVLMPDHLHLLCAPARTISLSRWVNYWKWLISRSHEEARWQDNFWDHRVRSRESFEKFDRYIRDNPVRAGLVSLSELWPYQGEIHRIVWW
jgi:putative transposase